MPQSVMVQLPHRVEYRMYSAKGVLHKDNGEPAVIHDKTNFNAEEFYEFGERHNEYGGAIRLGNGQDLAYFIRGYEFPNLEAYEMAIFNMNVVMDLVQDILDKAAISDDTKNKDTI